jgi:hypothetical protein
MLAFSSKREMASGCFSSFFDVVPKLEKCDFCAIFIYRDQQASYRRSFWPFQPALLFA